MNDGSERTLIFAGQDEIAARQLAQTLRNREIGGSLRSAYYFEGAEPCAKIIIMPDVPDFVARPIEDAFPGKFEPRQRQEAPVSPLADLPMMTTPMPAPKRRGRPPKAKVT